MLITPHESEHLAHPLGRDMVDVHEREARILHDMFLLTAALEACCYAETCHHVFVTLGTLLVTRGASIAVLVGKVAHRLVGAHHCHQFHDGDRPWLRVVHTTEEAQLGLVDVNHIGHILEVVCINIYIYSGGLSDFIRDIYSDIYSDIAYHHTATGLSHQGTGEKWSRKIAGAIFQKGRCDFAKWDMRFFGMAGAIFMGVWG